MLACMLYVTETIFNIISDERQHNFRTVDAQTTILARGNQNVLTDVRFFPKLIFTKCLEPTLKQVVRPGIDVNLGFLINKKSLNVLERLTWKLDTEKANSRNLPVHQIWELPYKKLTAGNYFWWGKGKTETRIEAKTVHRLDGNDTCLFKINKCER